MNIGLATANTLALVVHELATNWLKYGALSAATGTLDVSGSREGAELLLTWTERGGPPVVPPTGPGGYGTRLVAKTISRQLGARSTTTGPRRGHRPDANEQGHPRELTLVSARSVWHRPGA
jgi:two-component sensor histidine kinase